jgi:hypothetical protein
VQGLYASLELLPMWSGIEPDVQLFASGRVLDDDGEFAGGQSLGDSSGKRSMPHLMWPAYKHASCWHTLSAMSQPVQ